MNEESITAADREKLASRIQPTAYYQSEERETYLRFEDESSYVHISSTQKGFARRLVRHPVFELTQVTVFREDGQLQVRDSLVIGEKSIVVAVEGRLPVSHLSIPVEGRDQLSHAAIVSDGVYRVKS